MVRAAAKNHESVAVVVDPADYATLLQSWRRDGPTTLALRSRLAAKAFAHTAHYDTHRGKLSARSSRTPLSASRRLCRWFLSTFRPCATAKIRSSTPPSIAIRQSPASPRRRMLQGKELSFNNIADADAAIECVRQFEQPCCVIVKHANPCGVAWPPSLAQAYEHAYRTDPTSAFGGIIACNVELDASTAKAIIERQFVEVLAAPGISAAARKVLRRNPTSACWCSAIWARAAHPSSNITASPAGCWCKPATPAAAGSAGRHAPRTRQRELADLLFAWRVCQFVKSNAIVFARERRPSASAPAR